MSGIETVFSGDHLRALCHNSAARHLVVTFDHLRPGRRVEFGEIRASRAVLAAGRAHLQIHTARNDWFLNPDLPALRAALAAFTARFATVRGMGFSMGGYAALLLAQELRLRQVMLVSPQVSVLRGRVPWEGRWPRLAAALDPALDRLAPAPALRGTILFDPFLVQDDRRHAREIAGLFPGLAPVAIPFGGHPATLPFLRAGMFGDLLGAVIAGRCNRAHLHALRRQMRAADPVYRAAILAARAAGR